MKIHGLEITGMGPYAGTEKIDFDELDNAGVYLLTGPTGSGKTTVLDAISYSLFGEIPRASKGSEVVSHHREVTTTPGVLLEVTIGGERLRIKRVPEHERPKTKGEGTTTEKQSLVVERHSNERWEILTSNWSEGNEELTRRIGMNASQFSQVVMLPQGDFARFLRAKSAERKELLEQLFPGADLTWLEDWFKERAMSDRKARELKEAEIAYCFQAAKTSVPPDEDGEVVLPAHTEARPALDWIEATEKSLAEIDEACEKRRQEAAELAGQAETELKILEKKAELIVRRAETEKEQTELEARAEWRAGLGRELAQAEKAAAVLGLAKAAESRRASAETAASKAEEIRTQLAGNELTRDLEAQDYDDALRDFRAGITTITNFERDELVRRRDLTGRIKDLEAELERLSAEGPDSPVGKAEAEVARTEAAAKEAKLRLVSIREKRTRGMAAELARDLKPGEPCVVCGSVEHPSPAHGDELEFTAEDEREADEAAGAAARAEAGAREDLALVRSEAGEKRATAEAGLEAAKKEISGLAGRELELAEGRATVAERREELERAVEMISELIGAENSVRESVATAKQAEAEASEAASAAGFASTANALEAAREEPVLNELKTRAEEHDRRLAIVSERLTGELAGIDPAEELNLDPVREKARAAGGRRDDRTSESAVARKNLENFRQETGPVPGLFEQLGPLRDTADCSAELDRLARGTNERKMKLSIYVLATRLKQVIVAANRYLDRMSNQRFELVYSGDKAGNAMAGLGIEVFDAYTSETRPVSTLSGGESFYASLALALGLAEVVQSEAGGRSIETLFIDEGFGTLDAKSLDQVMDVIDSLRENGRSVGLVSHVEELRTRIHARIEVETTRQGSTLSTTTG